jgi:mono/diheme cytochrome c family protein
MLFFGIIQRDRIFFKCGLLAGFLALLPAFVGTAQIAAKPAAAARVVVAAPAHSRPFPLVFDADRKKYESEKPATNTLFKFNLTNAASTEVVIQRVTTSCGCTVAKLPRLPWSLKSGENGQLIIDMDLRGRYGTQIKGVVVHTTVGAKSLQVIAKLPARPSGNRMGNRAKNIQMALANRQAVFRGSCAACHVLPTKGKLGKPLYDAACGICHNAEHRASMVPDFRKLQHGTNAAYWKHWTENGKPGTLMPAFAQKYGGPLTAKQIETLVTYLSKAIPQTLRPLPPGFVTPAPARK